MNRPRTATRREASGARVAKRAAAGTGFAVFLAALLPGTVLHAATASVEGNVLQVLATGDGRFGGCMAALDVAISDAGLDCSGNWVTFSCVGEHADKEEEDAARVFESLRVAVVAGKSVEMRVTDEKKHGNYCHASRIKIQDEPHVDADTDGDGVLNLDDDVPLDASETVDTDDDGVGDNADDDDDNDGVDDGDDAFPLDPTESVDTDGDGIGDNADQDDDNDGLPDDDDPCPLSVDNNCVLDLVVSSAVVNDATPDAGGSLTLTVTVRNRGNVSSPRTTLRYYRSNNAAISRRDTEVGTDGVGELRPSESVNETIDLVVREDSGTYYYGACLDPVAWESDTGNNCSAAAEVEVRKDGASGDTRYEQGDTVTTMPTGTWAPDRVSKASFEFNGGRATIEFQDGGFVEEGDYRYTCRNARGCQVVDRVVNKGTIIESTEVVNGGHDMLAAPGVEVVLRSLESIECGSVESYRWEQLTGPPVSLDDDRGEAPRFVVPDRAEGTMTFRVDARCRGRAVLSDTIAIKIIPARAERILSALVDFEDVDPVDRPFSQEDLAGLLADDADSLANYVVAASRGLVDARFDVLDWVTVGKRRRDYPLGGGSVVSDVVDRLSEVADLGRYDKVFPAVFPLAQGYPGCQAYLEPVEFQTSKGTFSLGAAWLSGYNMGCVRNGRAAHEFGHTFGFVHSLVLHCHTNTGVPVSTIDPIDRDSCRTLNVCLNEECTELGEGEASIVANADPDMLGGDSSRHYEDFFPLVYQAVWQAHAGWLTGEQIVTTTGSHWITTLEVLSPTPKAVRIRLGRDHAGGTQEYWLETRKPLPEAYVGRVESCSLAVRLASPNRYSGERFTGSGDSGYTDTLRFEWGSGRLVWQLDDYPTYRGVRDGEPFWDPYRGVRFELAACVERDYETAVRVNVARSELRIDPPVVAVLRDGSAVVTVTNRSEGDINIKRPDVGGRHAEAFDIVSDGCGGAALGSGKACRIEVRSIGNSLALGFLRVPNDDELAPDLTVSLLSPSPDGATGSSTQIPVAPVDGQ